jgi:hypothetical protein
MREETQVIAGEEELRDLDRKVKQLKLDYERYFLGTRPREPLLQRQEVDKLIVVHASTPIKNTALRFKFNSICSRYQALKRQWTEILRKIEQGTYERHRFKADLHERQRLASASEESAASASSPGGAADPAEPDLFSEYRDARLACGQAVQNLSPEKFEKLLDKQRAALRKRYGNAEFRFRVAVEQGKAKLKASLVQAG